jgi:hypothetical protein
MKKNLAIVAVLAGAVLVTAYFNISGRQVIITIPEAEIQATLQNKLPFSQTHYQVLQVTLDNPKVSLQEDGNRVKLNLDLVLNITEEEQAGVLTGSVDISGGIRYEKDAGQFFLHDPHIESINMPGMNEEISVKLKSAFAKMLPVLYGQNPIHILSDKEIAESSDKLLLGNIVVKNRELVVRLGRE